MSSFGANTSSGQAAAHTTDSRAVAGGTPERCVSCILSTSVRGLGFDERGTCDLCVAHKAAGDRSGDAAQRQGSIEDTLEKVRELGKHRKYDCLVGLSGGRDSSYLLYRLVEEHKLRCLVAYYRTPFTEDVIDENVHRVVDTLSVPLVKIDISQEYHRRFARKVMLLCKKRLNPTLVNLMCAPCKYVNREAFKVARRNDIKSIIYGGTPFESFQLGAGHTPARRGTATHSLQSQLAGSFLIMKRGASLLAKFPGLIPLIPAGFKSSLLYVNPHTPYLRMRYSDVRRCDYFFHEGYDEAECIEVITSKLGWRLPPSCNSYWKADCSLAEVKNLLFRRIVGASYMDAYLSNMVRAGVISRDEALSRLKTEGRVSEHRVAHVAEVLGVDLDFLLA